MKYGMALLALLALGAALEWHGFHRGYRSGVTATNTAADKRVGLAQRDANQADVERDAANHTLAQLRRKLDDQHAQLQLASAYADAALADRNRVQHQLDTLHAQSKTALHETATHQSDCASLLHQPVCSAVAERLWGTPVGEAAHGD